MVALTGDGTGMIHGGDGTAVLLPGQCFICPEANKVALSRFAPGTPVTTEGGEGTVGGRCRKARPGHAELQQHPPLHPVRTHAAASVSATAALARLPLTGRRTRPHVTRVAAPRPPKAAMTAQSISVTDCKNGRVTSCYA